MPQADEANNPQGPNRKTKWAALAALFLLAEAPMASGRALGLVQEEQAKVSKAPIEANKDSGRRIVVSIPQRKLALMENGCVNKVYPVAVGAPPSPSPTGEFKIVQRIAHPTYYGPPGSRRRVVPPGISNPLGTRWLGLNLKGFGIHGTNEPRSIGRRASHGCIRMRNGDVEELFALVRVGDVVELHGDALLAQIFDAGGAPAMRPAPVAVSIVTPVAAGAPADENSFN